MIRGLSLAKNATMSQVKWLSSVWLAHHI